MEFHQFTSDVLNLITHYDENSITVNNQTFKQNIVVYQNQIDLIVNIDDLEKIHFKKIVKLKPEILLIGVKSNFKLNVSQHKNFIHNQIAVEQMRFDAACRTFNILMSEQRNVVMIVILEL
jgi:uncharacterized protein